MIQTNVLVIKDRGLNLDIEPKAITRPNGNAPTSVIINNFNVCMNPTFNASNTIGNCSVNDN